MRYGPLAFAIGVLLLATPAYAQLGLPGIENALMIGLTPAHPGPHDHVHLTVQSSAIDLSQSAITWSSNGTVMAQGMGVTSADVVAGALGTQTKIGVEADAPDGTIARAQAVIAPTEVDLLFEADSYVPPFYKGRALPSANTNVIVQAIPHFVNPDGSEMAAAKLVYTWKKDGQVMGTLSGTGKSSAIIPAPLLYGSDDISVDVASADNTLSGTASVNVASVDPGVVLYEDHPLYGILYNNALRASTFIPESEMTFAAVPYFAAIGSPNDSTLQYAWNINGAAIAADPKDPSEITINANNSSGIALIGLELTDAINYFLDAKGGWSVTLSSVSGGGDAFHTGAQ
jgi:hypothetical protein